jgi:hypothetical protein
MDWIEHLFGLAPDGGDGSLERLIAVVAVLVIVGLTATLWWGQPLLRALSRRVRGEAPVRM